MNPRQPRRWHEAWVGGVDAAHVSEDLAGLRLERGGERDRRRVGAAPTKSGHVHLLADPLEPGHHDHPPAAELAFDPSWRKAHDARPSVPPVGLDAGLEAEQRDRRHAELIQGHRHQWCRDALTCREQLVQLARRRISGHPGGKIDQAVGRVAHGADHDDEVVPRALAGGDALRRSLDPSRRAE